MLTKEQAQVILDNLNINVIDLVDNQPLIEAIRALKNFTKENPFVHVSFDVGTDDKVFAIKVVRIMLNIGLKEAKDLVDRTWMYSSVVDLGLMHIDVFKSKLAVIANDTWMRNRYINWITE